MPLTAYAENGIVETTTAPYGEPTATTARAAEYEDAPVWAAAERSGKVRSIFLIAFLRSQPNTTSGTYMNGFFNGKELTVLGEEGWYYHVRVLIGGEVKTGYMHKLLVLITSSESGEPEPPRQPIDNGTYFIKSVYSNKYMTTGLSSPDNFVVQIEPYRSLGLMNQCWKLDYKNDGYYEVASERAPANTVLDVKNAGTANGTELQVASRSSNSPNQRFNFRSADGGKTYWISPQHATNKVLDVRGPSTENNAKIQLWGLVADATQQQWRLALVDAFYYNSVGLPSRTVRIQLIGNATNSAWVSIINAARNSWNNSVAGVNITTTTTEAMEHKLTVDAFGEVGWDGLYDPKDPQNTGFAAYSLISINTTYFDRDGDPNTYKQAVVAHEMGHMFWLEDNPFRIDSNTTKLSIMQYEHVVKRGDDGKMIYGIYTPQAFDVENIKFWYE